VNASEAFRRGNEAIAENAQRAGLDVGQIDFICECSDPDCLARVPLELSDYERIREAGRAVALPGHDIYEALEADTQPTDKRNNAGRDCDNYIE